MPDRMKAAITTGKSVYKLGDELDIQVNAVNLFGPPAVGGQFRFLANLKQSHS